MKDSHKKDAELSKFRQRKIVDLERTSSIQKKIGELNARLAAIVEHSSDAIIGKDLNGVIISWNKGAERIYGYTAEEMLGRPISMLAPSGYADEIPRILEKIRLGENVEHYETMRVGKDGRQAWVSLTVSPIKNFKGEIIGASTIARDITRRKKAEEQIKLAKAEWEQTFDAIPDIIAVIDNQHVIRQANKALAARLGINREELIGKHCYKAMCGLGKAHSNCPGSLAIVKVKEQVEERFVKKLKGHYLISCTPMYACDGSSTCFVEVCRDISGRKEMEERLREAAITDTLTGLFNRRGFFTLAEQQITLAKRNKRNLMLLFLDLNNMKEINDKFGHKEGDQALIDTASLLRRTFRESDIIARMGGDEFAVLLTEPTGRDIEHIIFVHIQNNLITYNEQNKKNGRAYKLSLSMGTAYYDPERPCSVGDLLSIADAMMYEEKKRYTHGGKRDAN